MINEKSAKIGNRQLEEIKELLSILTSNKTKFKPEILIKKFFKQRRYLGSKDRKIISNVCYAFYRWYPFVKKLDLYEAVFLLIVFENIDHVPFNNFYLSNEFYKDKQLMLLELAQLNINAKIETLNTKLGYKFNKKNLFPEWMQSDIPDELLEEVIDGTQQRADVIIRTTSLYKNESFPFPALKHETLENAFVIPSQTRLMDSEFYTSGQIDIQDSGSQMICLATSAKENENWWDCCAGGGGKSLYLSQLMKNTGSILATDIRIHSLNEIERRAKLQKVTNIDIEKHDLNYKLQNQSFDGVIVDAPCSGSGTWRRHPADRWTFKMDELKQLNHLQYKILMNVKDNVKPGALLIYATCSVFKSENEEVVQRFLNENNDFNLDEFINPFSKENCSGLLRTVPAKNDSDGMFVARLRKSLS